MSKWRPPFLNSSFLNKDTLRILSFSHFFILRLKA